MNIYELYSDGTVDVYLESLSFEELKHLWRENAFGGFPPLGRGTLKVKRQSLISKLMRYGLE